MNGRMTTALESSWIRPDPVFPERVQVATTTTTGGVSRGPYESFNLAQHVGDDPVDVAENRRRLVQSLGGLPVQWLNQVHGGEVVQAHKATANQVFEADGAWTEESGLVLAVLTADVLALVLIDGKFEALAIAHAGWRGLVDGILEQTLAAFPGNDCFAWIGPGIGPGAYEVGSEVTDAVMALRPEAGAALLPGDRAGKSYLNLSALAEMQLKREGVEVYCDGLCTSQASDLYSYRRDGVTGRMATMVWLPEQAV